MASVEIVLKEDVEKLGKMGQVLHVRRGFFRNYLLPKGLAWQATPERLAEVKRQERVKQRRVEKERSRANEFAGRLSGLRLVFHAKAGEEGKLFGSVTSLDIQQTLQAQGFSLDRRQIVLEEPIKVLGSHEVSIRIFQDVSAVVHVVVEPES